MVIMIQKLEKGVNEGWKEKFFNLREKYNLVRCTEKKKKKSWIIYTLGQDRAQYTLFNKFRLNF